MRNLSFFVAAGVLLGGACGCSDGDKDITFVVGTYGENAYLYSLDRTNLKFTEIGKAEALNASYALAGDVSGQDGTTCIYAVSEVGDGSGAYSFRRDGTGQIEVTAEKRQTGADPCFVLLHEGYMMTADYSGGSVSVFPVTDGGSIGDMVQHLDFHGSGPVVERQMSAHIHQLKAVPGSGEWILASDLGSDRIRLLRFSTDGGNDVLRHVCDIECPEGSGPRHMEFSKDGRMLYCITELSGEVLAYEMNRDEAGTPSFTLVQTVMADEVNAGGSADIHLHPDGCHLYTSHRLENDGISIFRTLPDGTLEKTGYVRTARHPRNFMITPDGSLLLVACRDDRMIQVFRINEDGSLTQTDSSLLFDRDKPSSVTVL